MLPFCSSVRPDTRSPSLYHKWFTVLTFGWNMKHNILSLHLRESPPFLSWHVACSILRFMQEDSSILSIWASLITVPSYVASAEVQEFSRKTSSSAHTNEHGSSSAVICGKLCLWVLLVFTGWWIRAATCNKTQATNSLLLYPALFLTTLSGLHNRFLHVKVPAMEQWLQEILPCAAFDWKSPLNRRWSHMWVGLHEFQ